ncbi:hypothetical protein GPECTOR_7g971 [Gonium pectorale]|uniref:Uncharacterized protein n=1 Tax=Gonium pectorale TaxID=33097 RepID=A0A150GUL4_GONPE|nr:hypothetical protein GPECTOR_7g971 [Gonium pectorale]|eukprot:KXZ53521.1 hypothetical protein GPECTOR_7g971 [Gonium pectorale]
MGGASTPGAAHGRPETSTASSPSHAITAAAAAAVASARGAVAGVGGPHGDGLGALLQRGLQAGPGRWPLRGLTFRPLAECRGLHTLELHDLPPQSARPPGLPPDALLSVGALSCLRSLAVTGAAASVDLAYCLTRLTLLTSLELALLPAAFEAGGRRRLAPQPPPLARLTGLRKLSLRLVPLPKGGGGAGADASLAAIGSPLPPELAGVLRSVALNCIDVLHLDLPAPLMGPGGASATDGGGGGGGGSGGFGMDRVGPWGGGGGNAGAAGRPLAGGLAPSALACSCEVLSWLLREGMSPHRLEVLRLRSWRPYRGAPGVRRHEPEVSVRGALRAMQLAVSTPTSASMAATLGVEAALVVAAGPGGGAGGFMPFPGGAGPHVHPPQQPAPHLPGRLARVEVQVEEADHQRLGRHWDAALFPGAAPPPLASEEGPRAKVYEALACVPNLELSLQLPPEGPSGRLVAPTWVTDVTAALAPPGPFKPAYQAALSSETASALRWLPCHLPQLRGLTLPTADVDERCIALLAAGLPELRRLALGRVVLSCWAGDALRTLGSLPELAEVRLGSIRLAAAPGSGADPWVPAGAEAPSDAEPPAPWRLVQEELRACCRALGARRRGGVVTLVVPPAGVSVEGALLLNCELEAEGCPRACISLHERGLYAVRS